LEDIQTKKEELKNMNDKLNNLKKEISENEQKLT
jgi:hypothetical protein